MFYRISLFHLACFVPFFIVIYFDILITQMHYYITMILFPDAIISIKNTQALVLYISLCIWCNVFKCVYLYYGSLAAYNAKKFNRHTMISTSRDRGPGEVTVSRELASCFKYVNLVPPASIFLLFSSFQSPLRIKVPLESRRAIKSKTY